jgi:RsiW-degrading membrane proteinase PrsW (M82 family)
MRDLLYFGPFLACIVLQIVMLLKWKRNWFRVALLSLLMVSLILAITITSFIQQSNLWPIVMIFLSPLLLLGMIVLFIAHFLVNCPGQKSQTDKK